MTEEMSIIGSEAYNAAKEILEAAGLEEGDLFVVGCSTSEVAGAGIGTFSSPELAEGVIGSIYQATQETGVYLAAQCCEHLNRALILEKEAAARYGYEIVSVIPQPKAGGAFATAAYKTFEEAARLAAYYSKGRGSDKVEIDYVQKKHVKKPSGAKPGFVVYYTNFSMAIDSDISGIRQL